MRKARIKKADRISNATQPLPAVDPSQSNMAIAAHNMARTHIAIS